MFSPCDSWYVIGKSTPGGKYLTTLLQWVTAPAQQNWTELSISRVCQFNFKNLNFIEIFWHFGFDQCCSLWCQGLKKIRIKYIDEVITSKPLCYHVVKLSADWNFSWGEQILNNNILLCSTIYYNNIVSNSSQRFSTSESSKEKQNFQEILL